MPLAFILATGPRQGAGAMKLHSQPLKSEYATGRELQLILLLVVFAYHVIRQVALVGCSVVLRQFAKAVHAISKPITLVRVTIRPNHMALNLDH